MAAPDFTIADVLDWARTKPADGAYNYQHSGECALCLFLAETGRAGSPVVSPFYDDMEGGWHDLVSGEGGKYDPALEPALNAGETGLKFSDPRWTFGGLVKRLEKLVHETPITPSIWTQPDAYLTEQVSA